MLTLLWLGIFRSMNQLVSWNRRRFPLGHGPFANDTFCKTTGGLASLRKRHGIQCATMGTKEGTSRRDSPCQRHRTPPFDQSNCTPGKEVRSRTKPHPSSRMLPSVIGGRGRVLGIHRLSHRCHASALATASLHKVWRLGLMGSSSRVCRMRCTARKAGLAVPRALLADLSCEITKLLLNFTNYPAAERRSRFRIGMAFSAISRSRSGLCTGISPCDIIFTSGP